MGLYELLQQVITAFEELNIDYLVTGSIASMAYGEPRLTNDIDIVADIKSEQVSPLGTVFPARRILFRYRDGPRSNDPLKPIQYYPSGVRTESRCYPLPRYQV